MTPDDEEGAWLARALERAAFGVAVVDERGQVISANAALALLWGDDEAVGSALAEHIHDEDRELDHALSIELMEGRRSCYELERRHRTRADAAVAVREIVTRLDDPPRRVLLVRDLSACRRAEEERAVSRLAEMAAVIAHEVRNALAGIRSAVEVIGYVLPAECDERLAIDEVRTRIGDLDATMSDLLRFSRPEPVRPREVSARALLDRVAIALRASGTTVGLALDGADFTLRADEELLERALLDLCHNATQALAGSGSDVRVHLARDGPTGEISVSDEGAGIPPSIQARVWDPFFTTRSRGAGLGLPVARRIVEAHGGELLLETEAGRGTTVRVRLPLAGAIREDD